MNFLSFIILIIILICIILALKKIHKNKKEGKAAVEAVKDAVKIAAVKNKNGGVMPPIFILPLIQNDISAEHLDIFLCQLLKQTSCKVLQKFQNLRKGLDKLQVFPLFQYELQCEALYNFFL